MTIDEVIALRRIPTADEFVAFIRSQGWRITTEGGVAALVGSAKDPLIHKTAKMLSREPWRTNVLKLIGGDAPPYKPLVEPVEVPTEQPPAEDRPPGRDEVIAGVFGRARAAGKAVYGFSAAHPSCREVSGKDIPANFDRLCVEGEAEWTEVPR